MPNALAYAALLLWPLAAWGLVARLGPARGLIATLLLGYLLLPPPPAGFDLPLAPPLTKETIPSLAALLLLWRATARVVPESPVARGLCLLYLIGPWATVLTNPDPVAWGRVWLPGHGPHQALGITAGQVILLAPYLLARAHLAEEGRLRDLLWALLLAGLAYSLPMLLEVRLSPQINVWVYGYFQHLFEQMIRGDGFRPIVFLYHGLWAAFLAMTAALAALALLRDGAGGRRPLWLALAAAWMAMVVVLCKSLGSLVYLLLFAPAVLLLPARAMIGVAALLATLALAYPAAKGAHLVPSDRLVAAAARIDPERAHSLAFRFEQEERLLARAEERPLFGWGLWGRNHVWDGESGRIETITDGRWIILIGILGWSGFLAEFGLLALPLLMAWRRTGGPGATPPPVVAGAVALLLGINLADLIPNATVTPITMMAAGALLGWAERQRRPARDAAPAFRTVL